MRGYGNVEAVCKKENDEERYSIYDKEFYLNNAKSDGEKNDLEQWLEFDLFDENAFSEEDRFKGYKADTAQPDQKEIRIHLSLKLRDGISIRKYTTVLSDDEKEQPDYVQMYYQPDQEDPGNQGDQKNQDKRIPCIPGTSWAGAFRHQIKKLLPVEDKEKIMHDYFGMPIKSKIENEEKAKSLPMQKSKVRFSESSLKDGEWKMKTRNAIDRFTGGTVTGALYTEEAYFGGDTELTISFPDGNDKEGILWKRTLAAAITDLDQGFLSVGGLTAVGRGLFSVEKCEVNGKEIYVKDPEKSIVENEGTPELYNALIEWLIDKQEANK